MKHVNIALFVPHLGCPQCCSFCNQRTISGSIEETNEDDIHSAVKTALESGAKGGEIAFFGGSFTAIKRSYMIRLLECAYEYVKSGKVTGIRISTRPDCIDESILETLKKYGVTAIELGCQSMDDEVLKLNRRGHDSACVVAASKLIKSYGFELGLQMMTGLYGSDRKKDTETAEKIIALRPDTVRIYPTVILEGTENAERYYAGKYRPESLEEAVESCSHILEAFHNAGIKVIRLGLHSGGGVEEGYIAGAYHPAFRELCESLIWQRKTLAALSSLPEGKVRVSVNGKYLSQFKGQKKTNIEKFAESGYDIEITTDDRLGKYELEIKG